MSKYQPLTLHLLARPGHQLPMTFAEIEAVLGTALPQSAHTQRAFWSNNASNNVMTKAWRDAGFVTEQVDLQGKRLVFRRVSAAPAAAVHGSDFAKDAGRPFEGATAPHPLFGWLRGTVSAAADADLAAPVDPDWSQRIDDDQQPAA